MVSVHELVTAMELEQEQVFVDCVDCFVGSLVEPVQETVLVMKSRMAVMLDSGRRQRKVVILLRLP
jgi:hypothetical protein